MGKYEMGRTLGEGHFGKVKLARDADTGRTFAIKILDRQRILAMKINEQVRGRPPAHRLGRFPLGINRGRPRRRFFPSVLLLLSSELPITYILRC